MIGKDRKSFACWRKGKTAIDETWRFDKTDYLLRMYSDQ